MRLEIEAFVLRDSTRAALQTAMEHRFLARCNLDVFEGSLSEAAARYSEHPSPEFLFVETEDDHEALLYNLEALADVCGSHTILMIVGTVDSINLYKELIQFGVGYYTIFPVSAQEIVSGAQEMFSGNMAKSKAKVFTFIGAKGGCGASTIAHNFAYTLGEEFNQDVALVDLDVSFGTVGIDFNVEPRQGIREAIRDSEVLDQDLLARYMTEYGKHMRLLASPASLGSGQTLESEEVQKVLDVLRDMVSFVVLDVPHRWEPWVSEILTFSNETMIVAEPDLSSLRNAQMIMDEIGPKRSHEAPIRYLLNGIGLNKKSELSSKEFKEALGQSPFDVFPWLPADFRNASSQGQMLAEMDSKHKMAQKFRTMVNKLSGKKASVKPKKSFSLSSFFKRG